MQASQIQIVQRTWRQIATDARRAALLFHDHLFALDPSLRRLFPVDLSAHAVALFQTVGNAVFSLDDLELITPALEMLGRRHVDRDVLDADYAAFGHALLATLAEVLGDDYTPAVRHAWSETYDALAGIMRRAAAEHVAQRRATAMRAAIAASVSACGLSGVGMMAAFA